MRTISCLAAIIIIFAGSLGADARTMTLISPDKPAPVIVVGAEAAASEKYAAEELSTYLEKITGKKISVVDDGNNLGDTIIAVGNSKLTESIDISALDCEQFITDVQPNMVIIIGGRREAAPGRSPRDSGTLYGVYEFLDNLGVRWYRPEPWGEHVPKMKKIKLDTGRSVSIKPSYVMRSMLGGGMSYWRDETEREMEQAAAWAIRNRVNTIDLACRAGEYSKPVLEIRDVAKVGGLEHYEWGHMYKSLFPQAEYVKSHPEYFALREGKRDPGDGRWSRVDICQGNPEVQRIFAEKLVAKAKANPHWSSLSAEPDDCMGSQCECSLCKALDEPKNASSQGQGSNRVTAFNNRIAAMVAKEAPWVKVQWLAYSTHTEAPTNLKQLEPNTVIMLCPINELDDWTKKLMDASNEANVGFVKIIREWAALRPSSLMIYQYWEGYGWPGPMPVARTVADRLRSYRKLGISGIYDEPVVCWGPQGLDYYMVAKLMWNPDLDVDKELNLYYRNYYGPAEKPMKAYHERLMKVLEEHKFAVQSGGRGMHLIFTPKLVKELGGYMSEAQSLVKGQSLYERRLKGVWAGYEFSRRISEILVLKKKNGVLKDIPGWNGQGSNYKCPEAEDAYRDLIKWMRSINSEDAIFDMAFKLRDSDNPKKIFQDEPGTSKDMEELLGYLPYDVLTNYLTPNQREEVLLKDF